MLARNPKISVFVTSYNQKDYLVQALDSVLEQSLQPFEIIVVDDCSTDGSQDVINSYARNHPDLIRPFFHAVNQGIPGNKAFALEQVRGDYVSYLDGDDRFLPRKLEEDVNTLRSHPEASIAFANFYYIDENGIRIRLWAQKDARVATGYVFPQVVGRDYPRNTLFRNELVEYSALKQVGFYDKAFAMYHDWELRIRLTSRYRVAYNPKPLSEYRVHEGGISRSAPSRHLDELERAYAKNLHIVRKLPEKDSLWARERLFGVLEDFAFRSAIQSLQEGEKRAALRYAKKCFRYKRSGKHLLLLFLLALPHALYDPLRTLYATVKKRPRSERACACRRN